MTLRRIRLPLGSGKDSTLSGVPGAVALLPTAAGAALDAEITSWRPLPESVFARAEGPLPPALYVGRRVLATRCLSRQGLHYQRTVSGDVARAGSEHDVPRRSLGHDGADGVGGGHKPAAGG
jgi:hypothetical protein